MTKHVINRFTEEIKHETNIEKYDSCLIGITNTFISINIILKHKMYGKMHSIASNLKRMVKKLRQIDN